jgi:hypothetical protein
MCFCPWCRNTKITGFFYASVDEQLSLSPFLVDLRKRARLFQRIHTALMRQSRLQTCDSVIEDDDASIEEVEFSVVDNAAIEQQEKDFAISTNTRMTLALVKSMQSLCPGIFGALAGSLIELLCEIPNLGLASVHKYASEVVFNSNSNPEDRLQGVSLLLALGISRGSLRELLLVVEKLIVTFLGPRDWRSQPALFP